MVAHIGAIRGPHMDRTANSLDRRLLRSVQRMHFRVIIQIDLTELVSSIAVDAEFEAQEKGNRVVVLAEVDLVVLGDGSLASP